MSRFNRLHSNCNCCAHSHAWLNVHNRKSWQVFIVWQLCTQIKFSHVLLWLNGAAEIYAIALEIWSKCVILCRLDHWPLSCWSFFLIPFRRIQMHLKHQANLKVCPKKICWNYWKSKPTTQRNLRERLKVQYKNLIISKLKLFSKLLILIISILIFGLLILQSFRTKFSLKEWKGWKSTIGRWNEGMDFSRSFSWVW